MVPSKGELTSKTHAVVVTHDLKYAIAPVKRCVLLQSDVFAVLLALIRSLAFEEFRDDRREHFKPLDLGHVTAIFDDFDPGICDPRCKLLGVDR
jgi:hypothetical protein